MQPWRVWVLEGAVRDEICRDLVARYDRGEVSEREYNYYPVKWREPYLARRRACGWGLYGTLGIGREDKTRMHEQHARNYAFFDAPVGLIFSIDRDLEMGSWLDYGIPGRRRECQHGRAPVAGRRPRGPMVGIAGAPETVPRPTDRLGGEWSICVEFRVGDSAYTTVMLGPMTESPRMTREIAYIAGESTGSNA